MLGREWFKEKSAQRPFVSHRHSVGDTSLESDRPVVNRSRRNTTSSLPPGGLEKVFPAQWEQQALKDAVDRSLGDRKKIPYPNRGWTGKPLPKEVKDRYLNPPRPVSTLAHSVASNSRLETSADRGESADVLARARLIGYVEKRLLAMHPPSSWAPRIVSEQLNPGLSRPTHEWIANETIQVLRSSDAALSASLLPTPPTSSRFNSPQLSPISTFNDNSSSQQCSSPSLRRRQVPSRHPRQRARSEPPEKTLWETAPPYLEGKQLEMEAAWASISSPTTSPKREQRVAETEAGKRIELSPASAVGFAFARKSLPTLQRDGLWSSAGQRDENFMAQRNDPAVLTHGERGEDGRSLGRWHAENQGLDLAVEVSTNKASKISQVELKWKSPKIPLSSFLPPTTPF